MNRSADSRRHRIVGRRSSHPLEKVGSAPDPRFTFANERTFLAWNRTALTLIAGGLAVGQFLDPRTTVSSIIAVGLILAGGGLGLGSYRRWEANERALRCRRPLDYPRWLWAVPGGIVVIACGAAVVLITGLR